MYTRKTIDVWEVQVLYLPQYGYETVTCEDNKKEAYKRLKEYRENEPQYPSRLIKRREKKEQPC